MHFLAAYILNLYIIITHAQLLVFTHPATSNEGTKDVPIIISNATNIKVNKRTATE